MSTVQTDSLTTCEAYNRRTRSNCTAPAEFTADIPATPGWERHPGPLSGFAVTLCPECLPTFVSTVRESARVLHVH